MEKVENDPTHTDEQRQVFKDRLDNLNTEKQARLEMLSQNRKDLQTQVARIRQILEKISDKNTSWPEKILILIREHLRGIATIVLSVMGDFGGCRETGGSPLKDKGTLKKMVRLASRCTQKTCGKDY